MQVSKRQHVTLTTYLRSSSVSLPASGEHLHRESSLHYSVRGIGAVRTVPYVPYMHRTCLHVLHTTTIRATPCWSTTPRRTPFSAHERGWSRHIQLLHSPSSFVYILMLCTQYSIQPQMGQLGPGDRPSAPRLPTHQHANPSPQKLRETRTRTRARVQKPEAGSDPTHRTLATG